MSRIYSDPLEIDEQSVRSFYDLRASRFDELGNRAVLLGDHCPEIAEKIDRFETETILPMLLEERVGNVLDLGCGVGRWAQKLLPYAESYRGVDLSEQMVHQAERTCAKWADKAEFFAMSAEAAADKSADFYGKAAPFDTVLVSEVCMYINDATLESFYPKLIGLLAPNCRIYHADTVALRQRLTLSEHYSDALKASYSVIYRPAADLKELWGRLKLNISDSGYFPGTDTGAETARWYAILKK